MEYLETQKQSQLES